MMTLLDFNIIDRLIPVRWDNLFLDKSIEYKYLLDYKWLNNNGPY
jgi:hypothetical protein